MKRLFFPTVHPLVFLTAVPPAFLFAVALRYHEKMDNAVGLIPMAVLAACVCVFCLVYFFRGVVFSPYGVTVIGLFSSRDLANRKRGKKLILEKYPKGTVHVSVYGSDGEAPALSFLKDRPAIDICGLRETLYAGDFAIYAIGKLYGVPRDVMARALTENGFVAKGEGYSLTAEVRNELRVLTIEWREDPPPRPQKSAVPAAADAAPRTVPEAEASADASETVSETPASADASAPPDGDGAPTGETPPEKSKYHFRFFDR